jgi:peptide/nickel transport system permease protein
MRVLLGVSRAVLQAVVVGFLVAVIVFLLIHLVPGDPAVNILGLRSSPAALAALHHRLHLDEPLATQFRSFVGNLAHGDLGRSIFSDRKVTDIIVGALPTTFSVVGLTVLIALLVGIPIGIWGGLSKSSAVDRTARALSIALLATPPFYTGVLLIFFMAVRWHVAPAGGWAGSWPANFRYVWMPALALACYLGPVLARTVRQTARATMREHFVDATLARGIAPARLVVRHVLPNSLLPVVTLIGYNVSTLIGGAVVIESLFSLPGLGQTLAQAVGSRDYPVIQGTALVTGLLVVATNLITDAIYSVLDPRIRKT